MKASTNEWDVKFPDGKGALQPSHLRQPPTWAALMREIDADWRRYMQEHDRPDQRLATKLRNRFRL